MDLQNNNCHFVVYTAAATAAEVNRMQDDYRRRCRSQNAAGHTVTTSSLIDSTSQHRQDFNTSRVHMHRSTFYTLTACLQQHLSAWATTLRL